MLTVRSEIGPYRRHSDFIVFLRKLSTTGAALSFINRARARRRARARMAWQGALEAAPGPILTCRPRLLGRLSPGVKTPGLRTVVPLGRQDSLARRVGTVE